MNLIPQTMNRMRGKEEAEEPIMPDERFVPQKLDPAFLYAETPKEVHPVQPKASDVVKGELFSHVDEDMPTNKTPLQSVSVSMEDLPFTFETPVEEVIPENETGAPVMETPAQEVAEALPIETEPTVLEYKRRLNELLSQK
jgi:hypothetical protein